MCEEVDAALITGEPLSALAAAHLSTCPRCQRLVAVTSTPRSPVTPSPSLPSAHRLGRALLLRRLRLGALGATALLLLGLLLRPGPAPAPAAAQPFALRDGADDVFAALDLVEGAEADDEALAALALLDPYEDTDPTDPMDALLGEGAL